MNELFLAIPISDILNEVDSRSSRLAVVSARDNKKPELEDAMRLSDGKMDVFNELLESAAHESYDYVKAFGKKFSDGITVAGKLNKVTVYKTPFWFNIAGRIVDKAHPNFNAEVLYDGDIKVGFEYDTVSFPQQNVHCGFDVVVRYKVYDSQYGGLLLMQQKIFHVTGSPSVVSEPTIEHHVWEETFTPDLVNPTEGEPQYTLASLSLLTVTVENIKELGFARHDVISEGDAVTYYDELGNESKYIALTRSAYSSFVPDNNRAVDEFVDDVVVFHLEAPDWWDDGMESSVKRYLKSAIINHILYRWFEIEAPKEADTFESNFEEYGHKAQMAMNAERKHLRRGTCWL